MNRYPKYKNSTIDWLGEIPEHWIVRRIKYVFDEVNERSENGDEELLSVSQFTGVTKKSEKVEKGGSLTNAKTLEGYKLVKNGDLVINIMLAWNGSLGISPYNGITSPAYSVYRSKIGGENYFGYLFTTPNAKQEFKKQSTGIIESRLRMYTDSFFDIKTAIPPKQEQTTIANFLDYKLEKIDRFITKKKQLIKLLNEQKAAIINQTVTKGVPPNDELGIRNDELGDKQNIHNSSLKIHNYKDSGIEWLGDIPESWEVKPLKYIANSVLGKILCNKDKGGYKKRPYLKSKNIQWLNVDISDVEEMWFSEKEMSTYRLKEDDLVISEGGEVGKTCLWTNQLNECYIQNSAHNLVAEYKTALIAEAVTGKIDVRNYEL